MAEDTQPQYGNIIPPPENPTPPAENKGPLEPPRGRHNALIAGAIFLVVALSVSIFLLLRAKEETVMTRDEISSSEEKKDLFASLSLEAKSVYVFDLSSGEVIFEKNAEAQLPLASLTKAMVALAATDVVPDYFLVRITSLDLGEQGDTGLFRDEEWNIKKLLDFALIVSSNDGIRAIASAAGYELKAATTTSVSAEALFVERMNTIAKDIGMTETYFLNGSGLDLSGEVAGSYGSAQDMALLFAYIIKNNPSLLEATTFNELTISSNQKTHKVMNTNKVIGSIPNVLASKTGYTELSGGNLVVAFDAGIMKPVIISILGSSYDGRFTDMEKLVKAVLDQ